MKRRDFIYKGFGAGLVAGIGLNSDIFASEYNMNASSFLGTLRFGCY